MSYVDLGSRKIRSRYGVSGSINGRTFSSGGAFKTKKQAERAIYYTESALYDGQKGRKFYYDEGRRYGYSAVDKFSDAKKMRLMDTVMADLTRNGARELIDMLTKANRAGLAAKKSNPRKRKNAKTSELLWYGTGNQYGWRIYFSPKPQFGGEEVYLIDKSFQKRERGDGMRPVVPQAIQNKLKKFRASKSNPRKRDHNTPPFAGRANMATWIKLGFPVNGKTAYSSMDSKYIIVKEGSKYAMREFKPPMKLLGTFDTLAEAKKGKYPYKKATPRKRKNFHHNPNDETAIREVLLSVQNDHGFYEMVLKPAAKNMAIKQYKGRFNKTLALKMYKHVADRADKFYAWTYGDRTRGTRYWMAQKGFMLTPADRKQLAAELLEDSMEMIQGYVDDLKGGTKQRSLKNPRKRKNPSKRRR